MEIITKNKEEFLKLAAKYIYSALLSTQAGTTGWQAELTKKWGHSNLFYGSKILGLGWAIQTYYRDGEGMTHVEYLAMLEKFYLRYGTRIKKYRKEKKIKGRANATKVIKELLGRGFYHIEDFQEYITGKYKKCYILCGPCDLVYPQVFNERAEAKEISNKKRIIGYTKVIRLEKLESGCILLN